MKLTVLLGICIFILVGATMASGSISYSGDFNTTFYVSTSYYNVTITRGAITHLIYTYYSNTTQWGSQYYVTNGDMGAIYVGAFVLGHNVTTTNCINNTNIINCSNTNAENVFTFNESFIKINAKGKSGAYRYYMGALDTGSVSIIGISNGTQIDNTNKALQDWDSKTGMSSLNRTATSSTNFLAFTWDNATTTDFDYTTNRSGATQGIVIARGSEITANTSLTVYIKVLSINTSQSGNQTILQPLNEFKLNPLYGDPVTSSCTCPATNTNWVINLADNCVISSPCDIGTGNLSTTGTGNPFQINSSLWVNRLINWTNFILLPITGNSLGQRGQ